MGDAQGLMKAIWDTLKALWAFSSVMDTEELVVYIAFVRWRLQ